MTVYVVSRLIYRAHDPPVTDFIEVCKNEKAILRSIKKHFKNLNRPDLKLDLDFDEISFAESLGLNNLEYGDIVEYSFINPKVKDPYSTKTENFVSYGVIKTLIQN